MDKQTSRQSYRWLWACVALLFIGVAIRAHNIESLPPFNDESHHIRRAEEIYRFTNQDLNLTLGKLLSYYWIGAFQPDRLDAIFVGRTSTAIFSLIGLAATFATTKLIFGKSTALAALTIAIFAPFMIFFDRLALTDTLTAAVGMLLIGTSLKMMQGNHNRWWDRWAIGVGFLCGLVVFGKLLALTMIFIPLWAVLVYGNHPPLEIRPFKNIWRWLFNVWRHYGPMLGTIYSVFGLTMLPFVLHIVDRVAIDRQQVPIVNNNLINGAAEAKSPPDVIIHNLGILWETHLKLYSLPMLIFLLLVVGFVLWKRQQHSLFLLGSIVLAWSISIVVAAELSTRYLTLGVLPSIVLLAGGAQELGHLTKSPQKFRWILQIALAGWVLLFAMPFVVNSWNTPADLKLPERDEWEYFSNFSAGYGLVDAANIMETLARSEPSNRVNVLGLVGSCHQLRLYLDEHGPVWLECPFFGWQGEFMPDVVKTVDERLAQESVVFLLVEPELPYTDLAMLNVRWESVGRFPRPFDGMTVELYRIYPKDR